MEIHNKKSIHNSQGQTCAAIDFSKGHSTGDNWRIALEADSEWHEYYQLRETQKKRENHLWEGLVATTSEQSQRRKEWSDRVRYGKGKVYSLRSGGDRITMWLTMGSRISGGPSFSNIFSSGAMRWIGLLSSKKQKPNNSNGALDLWLQTGQQHIHWETKLEDLAITARVYH